MQGFLQNRFNSKRYAQKQIESLIDHRKQEMNASVYALPQNNQGLDTDDLIVTIDRPSQYNPTDFDPEWDAKERAKIKVYTSV